MRSIRDDPWWQLPVTNVELHSPIEHFDFGGSDSDHDGRELGVDKAADPDIAWLQEASSSSHAASLADAAHDRTPRVTSLLSAAEVMPDEVTREQPESEPGPDEARIQYSHREPSTEEAKRQQNS